MTGQASLSARPGPFSSRAVVGLQKLGLGRERDSYLHVPATYDPAQPLPLVLLLHGAGGHAHDGLRVLLHLADRHSLILLAPASHETTWDLIKQGAFGPDRDLADRVLQHVFDHYAIDPARLAIGGFSDGASYALSLGLANGDLFTHVLAFSPGFVAPAPARGAPKVFISHGTEDKVLPVEPCSRTIVHQLKTAGYTVRYDEFEGGHEIPPAVAQAGVQWFLDENAAIKGKPEVPAAP
jgi:predicted esterase